MSQHIFDIKQVSRLDDLRPATEKPINKASNMIKNSSEQVSAIDTAGRTGVSAIRQARMLSESSDRQEDQEAIDKLEASAQTASGDAATAAKESLFLSICVFFRDVFRPFRRVRPAWTL